MILLLLIPALIYVGLAFGAAMSSIEDVPNDWPVWLQFVAPVVYGVTWPVRKVF